jgi:hypothetical protein
MMHSKGVNRQRNRKDGEPPVGTEDAINRLNYDVNIARAQLTCPQGALHQPLACRQHWPGLCANPTSCTYLELDRTSVSAVILWALVRKVQTKDLRQMLAPRLNLRRCGNRDERTTGECLYKLTVYVNPKIT